jgi:hypothetical protein
MSRLIDGFGIRSWRVVPDAECQMIEIEATVLVLGESVHEAKRASGRWDVGLCAAGEAGAVPRVLVASE